MFGIVALYPVLEITEHRTFISLHSPGTTYFTFYDMQRNEQQA